MKDNSLKSEIRGRCERLQKWMKETGLDGCLISEACSLRYFTGFSGGEGFALFCGSDSFLITDSRYTTQAGIECPEAEVVLTTPEEPSYVLAGRLCGKYAVHHLGFEDEHMTCRTYSNFIRFMKDAEFVPCSRALMEMRAVKSDGEIELIARAEEIGSMAFSHVMEILRPGMTELAAAAEIEGFMKKCGAEKLSFDTIVGSGFRSALPHGMASEKELQPGDLVVMDFGCVYHGYCSDMTRTAVVGEPSDKQREIYDIVLEAQESAIRMIKPGVCCRDVDGTARTIIEEAGYGEYFGHGLGHSVGLYIHEEPRFSRMDNTILKPGMVVTVEPGIYLPGDGGVRIEDLIVVTEDGCRNLTSADKSFLVIK